MTRGPLPIGNFQAAIYMARSDKVNAEKIRWKNDLASTFVHAAI